MISSILINETPDRNTEFWKKKIWLHFFGYLVNAMAANDLVTQGARSSAGMVLTLVDWNALKWVHSGVTWFSFPLKSNIDVLMLFPCNNDLKWLHLGVTCDFYFTLRCLCNALWPLLLHGSTLIPAWISNYMPCNVWDEITYPFLNFNGCTVEV